MSNTSTLGIFATPGTPFITPPPTAPGEHQGPPIDIVIRYWGAQLAQAHEEAHWPRVQRLEKIHGEWLYLRRYLVDATVDQLLAWFCVPMIPSRWHLDEETWAQRRNNLRQCFRTLARAQGQPADSRFPDQPGCVSAAALLATVVEAIHGDPAVPCLGRFLAAEAGELWLRAWT